MKPLRGLDVHVIYLFLAGFVFFVPYLGVVHLFDWDEINFAESAREMIVSGNYFRVMIDFKPFWEKPPLFFWLQVISMKTFGISEFAARFPNAVFGILTLISVYLIGKKEKNKSFGLLWAVIFGGGLLPFFYFKSGIIDPVFNFFIFWSVYFLYKADSENSQTLRNAILAGTFSGLAVLTKGPVGFLLLLLTYVVILAGRRFSSFPGFKKIIGFALPFIVVTFFWYGFELIENGPWFLVEFIEYQIDLFLNPVAGHKQPLYYHFVVVFLGCFPFSIFALVGFRKNLSKLTPWLTWSKSLFWVVMILFTIVTTKIVHYSSMAYLPLSFIATCAVWSLRERDELSRALRIIYLVIGSILSVLFTLLPLAIMHRYKLQEYIDDTFTRDSLHVEVPMMGWEWMIGVIYLVLVIYGFILLKKDIIKGIYFSSIGSALFLWFVMSFMVPKVELISQGPAIEFFKSLQGKDVYVRNLGFKSYAQFFYFQQPQMSNPKRHDADWLISGDIDKPVYFITKSHYKKLDEMDHIQFIEQRGGFKLYVRAVNP